MREATSATSHTEARLDDKQQTTSGWEAVGWMGQDPPMIFSGNHHGGVVRNATPSPHLYESCMGSADVFVRLVRHVSLDDGDVIDALIDSAWLLGS